MNKKRSTTYIAYCAVPAALFCVPLITREPYVFHILCLIGINIIFACSLNTILNIGELNLAHAAFMGIGAYTSTLLVMKLSLPFWLAMPAAMLASAIISLAIGFLTLRFKGAYFLLFTFLFAELLRILLSNFWIDIFGGIPGVTNIPRPSITVPGLFHIKFGSNIDFYYLIMVLVILTILVMRRMDMSRIGMLFRAISQSESLVESTGTSAMRFKILGCAIGCAFAGLAGSLYAHFVGIITPVDFSIHAVLAPVAYVVVGGMGSIYGPVLGTSFLMVLSHFYLRQLGLYELLIYGVIIVIIIRFMPEGLISLPRVVSPWLGRLSRKE
jgi:branched-chain amino acid transport system permease protein